MKRLFFLLLFAAALPAAASAQVMVEDVNLNERTDIAYLDIMGIDMGVFKKKLTIIVDYGQKLKVDSDTRVRDATGKEIIFNSMIDAINFFHKNGWELFNAFPVSSGSSGQIYHYILKRKA